MASQILRTSSRLIKTLKNSKLNYSGSQLSRFLSGQEVQDEMTHTGQKFEPGDIRLMRFTERTKLVNKQQAIDLIADVPPQPCEDRVVACDGGGGPLGHPKVYINLDQPGNHSCGYCGLRFYLDKKH